MTSAGSKIAAINFFKFNIKTRTTMDLNYSKPPDH